MVKSKKTLLEKIMIILGYAFIGIIILFILIFLFRALSISKSSENSESISVYNQYNQEENFIKDTLNDKGYEVISVYISNYSARAPFFKWYNISDETICDYSKESVCYSDKVSVNVDIKSLGSRNEQVWDALNTMSSAYENAFTYNIDIKSPTDSCSYLIFGVTFRNYIKEINKCIPSSEEGYLSLNQECFNSSKGKEGVDKSRYLIQYQIDNLKTCS